MINSDAILAAVTVTLNKVVDDSTLVAFDFAKTLIYAEIRNELAKLPEASSSTSDIIQNHTDQLRDIQALLKEVYDTTNRIGDLWPLAYGAKEKADTVMASVVEYRDMVDNLSKRVDAAENRLSGIEMEIEKLRAKAATCCTKDEKKGYIPTTKAEARAFYGLDTPEVKFTLKDGPSGPDKPHSNIMVQLKPGDPPLTLTIPETEEKMIEEYLSVWCGGPYKWWFVGSREPIEIIPAHMVLGLNDRVYFGFTEGETADEYQVVWVKMPVDGKPGNVLLRRLIFDNSRKLNDITIYFNEPGKNDPYKRRYQA